VNWFEKHLGDWAKKTAHLSMLEEGAYNRLTDWCYAHERPLPLEVREVQKIARATTPTERKVVQKVLHEFFELREDGWHKDRIDKVIAAFQESRPRTQEARMAANERQVRARERRRKMFDALRDAGLSPTWNATTRQLFELCAEHGVTVPVTPVTLPVTRDESRESHGSHFPLPNNPGAAVTGHGSRHAVTGHAVTGAREPEDEAPKATRAGLACKAMRRAGLPDVNPSHPLLHRLLDAGVSDEELSIAAAEASARRKPFAYALSIVEGRRRDAAALGPVAPATQRESAASALMREFAPRVARGNGGST
jgi:uncharacterized protein YdaU (DUF1376 family)